MARPVDPELRAARRLQLIDAGLTVLAERGAAATTAEICRVAEIGSGTFFHHFPTKDALVVATIELGTQETRDFFAAQDPDRPPREVIRGYVDVALDDLADPRAAGFARAVGAMTHRPAIAAALAEDERAVAGPLAQWMREAQRTGAVRTDLDAGRLTSWIRLLVDGVAAAVAGGGFDLARERGVLDEQLAALLDGPRR